MLSHPRSSGNKKYMRSLSLLYILLGRHDAHDHQVARGRIGCDGDEESSTISSFSSHDADVRHSKSNVNESSNA